ncbi:hypothetical protein B0H13DRAFT_2305380 [Mycena leptocephala]|nr:hypothetical protein B0H13DRAFT_2305380 [Mycena leptocephala]
MVDKAKTKGPRMDTMQQFIPALLRFRRVHPDTELVVWKSDVSEAFRLTSVHKLAQIKQIAMSNLPTKLEVATGKLNEPVQRNGDWCSTLRNSGSPRIWASVMGLVIWIAIFIKLISDIFCYIDDTYGCEFKYNLTYYGLYKKIPTKQAHLLFLWDFLGETTVEAEDADGHCEPNPRNLRGGLKDVRDVLNELDGPSVDAGVDGRSSGGVTDAAHCMVAMWMDGRTSQKDVVAAEGAFMANGLALGTGASSTASIRFTGSLARFLSRSFLFSRSVSSLSVCGIGHGEGTHQSPLQGQWYLSGEPA